MCWMCDEIDQAFEDEMDVSTRVWWKPWTWFLPSRDEYANQYHPGYETCQNCGRLICYDFQGHDDVTAMPYVTCAGDLFCSVCGPRYDEPEDEDYDELDGTRQAYGTPGKFDMMEPWQHKFIGDREVESYRGRKIFESKLGTFGYEAWMTKLGDGWFCPYTSIDGAKQAIDALERMLEIWNRG